MLTEPQTEDNSVPSGKLILPPPPTQDVPRATGQFRTAIHPGLLIRQSEPPAPRGLMPKISYYWRKDPAYKVLFLSITLAVIAAIFFVSLAGAALSGKSLFGATTSTNVPTYPAPKGTVDLQPTFSKPNGGQGSNQSSQPPAVPTPATQNTPTGNPSPQPTSSSGNLSIQIVNYPQSVRNFNYATVVVSTNQPGITVTLVIRYNVQPGRASSPVQVTDGNGNATLSWLVAVFAFGRKNAQAFVYAVASDQNGNTVASAPITIQITGNGQGG